MADKKVTPKAPAASAKKTSGSKAATRVSKMRRIKKVRHKK